MSDFSRLLWAALWNADLFSVPELYGRCQVAVQKRGQSEREFLVAQIGEAGWQQVLTLWGRPDAETQAVTQLGLGAVLTEFLAAPAGVNEERRIPIARLGTLANFLIGVYDDVIDEGTSGITDPLPSSRLRAMMRGEQAPAAQDTENAPLALLAAEYFRQVAALPGSRERSQVVQTLSRAVMKMYEAERTTFDGTDATARLRGWTRKSALPFVVMALPAWLEAPEFDAGSYVRHLRWLWRCGEFWGWVDDAVDLTDDVANGHPNRAEVALQTEVPPALAARIADKGRNVIAGWHAITPHAAKLPLPVQEAIPICLFAAVGYSLHRERKEVNTE